MFLMYHRLYITYTLIGHLFNLDHGNVCRDIQKIESLIRKCLPIPPKLYKKIKRLKTPQEVEEYFPGFMAFIYRTEQQIPSPKNKRMRKMYYSGKKKKYIVKNKLMVNKRKVIIYKTKNKQVGRRHDYYIYKRIIQSLPRRSRERFGPRIPESGKRLSRSKIGITY